MTSDSKSPTARPAKYIDLLADYGIYVVLVLLCIIFSSISSVFFTGRNIINILQQAAPTGIASVGMVFVLLTAGVDISLGSTMFMSATFAAMAVSAGYGLIAAILLAIAGGGAVGALNGFVVSRFRIPPFIVTLATLSIARGIALWVSKATLILLRDSVTVISSYRIFNVPLPVYLMLGIMIIGDIVLKYTQFGRQLYAIGNDPAAAVKTGIPVRRSIFIAYLACGAIGGFAGFILACQLAHTTPNFALGTEFVVISAIVIGGVSLFGGKGKIFPGAFVGVLTVMVIQNGLVIVQAPALMFPLVRAVIIFVAVMADSIRNSGEIR